MTGYAKNTLRRAKRLRSELTDAERKLRSALRNRQVQGAKFRRQQPIGPFIVDFVCQDRQLIVEADGGQHSNSNADKGRTAYLKSKGYLVLRFWNNDILTNLEGVAERIAGALSTPHPARAGRESPSPSRGEGYCGASHG